MRGRNARDNPSDNELCIVLLRSVLMYRCHPHSPPYALDSTRANLFSSSGKSCPAGHTVKVLLVGVMSKIADVILRGCLLESPNATISSV